MTDRELLDLAAFAAGIKTSLHKETDSVWIDGPRVWNPLTDDGDALRLAVELKIDVKHYDDHVVGWFDCGYIGAGRIPYEGDPYAATRRAIVQAAAELGKGMK